MKEQNNPSFSGRTLRKEKCRRQGSSKNTLHYSGLFKGSDWYRTCKKEAFTCPSSKVPEMSVFCKTNDFIDPFQSVFILPG